MLFAEFRGFGPFGAISLFPDKQPPSAAQSLMYVTAYNPRPSSEGTGLPTPQGGSGGGVSSTPTLTFKPAPAPSTPTCPSGQYWNLFMKLCMPNAPAATPTAKVPGSAVTSSPCASGWSYNGVRCVQNVTPVVIGPTAVKPTVAYPPTWPGSEDLPPPPMVYIPPQPQPPSPTYTPPIAPILPAPPVGPITQGQMSPADFAAQMIAQARAMGASDWDILKVVDQLEGSLSGIPVSDPSTQAVAAYLATMPRATAEIYLQAIRDEISYFGVPKTWCYIGLAVAAIGGGAYLYSRREAPAAPRTGV